ncbi:MAG: hypothetical protein ACJ75F_12755 [Flavisolibacter sp.]|jgi:hypothetical protein
MKQAFLILVVAGSFCSCNSSDQASANDTDETKVAAATDTTAMNYAYTIEKPDQWVTGSRENTRMVLASLKNWENGDMKAAINDFADTVKLEFDGYEAKLPRDSVMVMFQNERKMVKSVQVIMDDFESVKSKDGTKEYVSLWYKQKKQDLKDKWDSLEVMDDLLIKNGEIRSIDEKTRHYPAKKM